MEFNLYNEYISVVISSLGAQLMELKDKDGLNRLHDGNPAYWSGRSPVLFPIISRFADQKYYYNGNEYNIGTHGFARHKEFELIEFLPYSITFMLQDDEETYKSYPFHFQFFVTYTLEKNVLKVSFKVINTDTKIIYYMIGGHPGFKVPLYEKEKYEDYAIVFENKETVSKNKLNGSYLSNEVEPFLYNQDRINLKYKLFDPDAFVMRGLTSKYVDIISKNHDKKIRFYFSEFETLAIWSTLKVDSPFVCLEPWYGLRTNIVPEIEKMNIKTLQPTKVDECSYKIEIIG